VPGPLVPPRHHVFPQENREWFNERNFDIDRVTVELDHGTHTALHTMGWNDDLMRTLTRAESQLDGQRLSPKEIREIGYRELRRKGIRNPFFLPYKD